VKAAWDHWKQRWENALLACSKLGGRADELVMTAPAAVSEVEKIEAEIRMKLPESFRRVVTGHAASMRMFWHLQRKIELPTPLKGIFCGNCEWDLSLIPEWEIQRKHWITSCFPNPQKPGDKIWHDKLAFHGMDIGDMLAFDLAQDSFPVVYLSHDLDESHGYVLGKNFEDFMDKWTQLGCPGAEDWQMLPFTHDPMSGLDPDCENARLWKKLFGLPA
jgi:hypothetical protein